MTARNSSLRLSLLSRSLCTFSASRFQSFPCQNGTPVRRSAGIPTDRNAAAILKKYSSSNLISNTVTKRYLTATPHLSKRIHVLGIETSCDDTGAAIVNDQGEIVSDCLNSQTGLHVELGGINPPIARQLHQQNIHDVVTNTLQKANMSCDDLDAIAVTVKPGLIASLLVGFNYAKQLVHDHKKPIIPIHHMEAHALTARMIEQIEFPFLVLLMSGGHCLLAVAHDINRYQLLGSTKDDAPGDALDKTARLLRLKNLPECDGLSGGRSIELMAAAGDPQAFPLETFLNKEQSCNFSFSGLKNNFKIIALKQEKIHGISSPSVLPNISDVCASFQYSLTHHIAKRLQRALVYCEQKQLLPEHNKTVVISGGVASNDFILKGLTRICDVHNCRIVRPPPRLCTDNGIMIAWNGVERYKANVGVLSTADEIEPQPRCPLGEDISEDVIQSAIKLDRIKLL